MRVISKLSAIAVDSASRGADRNATTEEETECLPSCIPPRNGHYNVSTWPFISVIVCLCLLYASTAL